MTDDLGRGAYRVEVDDEDVVDSLGQIEDGFSKAGTDADSFGQKGGEAFEKTGSSAEAASRKISGVSLAAKAGLTVLGGAAALQRLTLAMAAEAGVNPDLIRREEAPYREAAALVEDRHDW